MIKNKTLYNDNDEHFGPIMSNFYNLFTKMKSSRDFYYFIINDIEKIKFSSILDIGCGTGFVINKIAENKKGIFYGVDPSPYMIRIAKRNRTNVKFVIGSNRKLPTNEKFDIIITSLSFHHWPDKEQTIKYIVESLNINGKFIIYEHNKNKMNVITKLFAGSHAMTENEFKTISVNTGFNIKIRKINSFIIAEIKK